MVTSAFTPTLLSAYSTSDVRYAGLMLTRIRPIFAVAICISTHGTLLCDQMPTRSPGCKPRFSNALARRFDAVCSSR
jgi:hypothetical protein